MQGSRLPPQDESAFSLRCDNLAAFSTLRLLFMQASSSVRRHNVFFDAAGVSGGLFIHLLSKRYAAVRMR